ncbi:MAG: adenylate kinase [Candidatus Nitrosocaldus sp.]|nr:adenylate kinase [Candidatus Nitrosocaldus sp.]MCS7140990.1 adenylate kinase [Candidatus Nitrosocaldus sp.]MDW7999932.1 adenylate kinase [Candidatus Nitrosocaldus sp.]MDW8275424.1 adenylate kinase [Candidatus Nitrosocaldus sp.]
MEGSRINNKRAIVVGIPGVGKTTVITRAVEMLSMHGLNARLVVFGTVMFEEAMKMGVRHRDEMRRMSVEEQRRLQENAALKIASMSDDVIIIDTHLFISTKEGYYPGLPLHLLNLLKPTNLILVAAEPREILGRRMNDKTRQRDLVDEGEIAHELEIARIMLAACSILTGAPFAIVMNREGRVDEASQELASLLADGRRGVEQ